MTFRINTLLLVTALLLTFNTHAAKLRSDNITEFQLMPVTCIVASQGDSCELLMDINWQLLQPQDICLWQDQQQLLCWQQQLAVQQKFPVKLLAKTLFSLRDKQTERLLAEQHIEMKFHQPKNYRRRLRSGWSIF